ncbi:double-strand-break repair protein rad21 [Magnaporthiopsis poae ATCC 64411]|uniref:Double-strand-break repair protein rad21 n=1 Tax=Magnaporthiopsis poae (strain ATCC 64411 / 73-15) TaxID=644358 RepID=A0A0C4DVP4_MAGP6|nr:double-strand-break repair protein rad21 [Magnaporthiopsis poae ATCC 64411]
MFYSDTLVNQTGPLARVWLAANMERKLSKGHILNSNLSKSVEDIIRPIDNAPLALRFSSQLLLGVVRIYSRKARYLLDDCNEALIKIKMTFRSTGNNDLPIGQHVPNREALMIPDRITPLDNLDLLPAPNLDDFTSSQVGRRGRVSNRDINLQEDFNNSQFLQDDEPQDDLQLTVVEMEDLDLELDFGMDLDLPSGDKSIEMGRDAPAARSVEDDLVSELAAPSKEPERELSLGLEFGDERVRIADTEGDVQMFDDDFEFNLGDQSAMPQGPLGAVPPERARISESPLSDIDPEFAQEIEMEYTRTMNEDMYEPGDDTEQTVVAKAPQRAKKRRLLVADSETMLTSNHIREQQAHHENILKPQSFVPREPYLLALMEMQKNGGFVASVIMDARSDYWAPELKGLLSLSAIRPVNDLKRKRDSGIADIGSEDEQGGPKSPRLDIGGELESFALGGDETGIQSAGGDATVLEIPADEGYEANDDTIRPASREGASPMPAFDDTVAPLVHPADSGPISIGTRHAVHILRDLFGPEAATDEAKRRDTSVVFQELLPESRTTKADATKMFFECLVLATKDAIKVEQPEEQLGGPIRVRGKRGLWGAWAEREAGGELAQSEEEEQEEAAPQSGPQPAVSSTSMVSVEA